MIHSYDSIFSDDVMVTAKNEQNMNEKQMKQLYNLMGIKNIKMFTVGIRKVFNAIEV